MARKQLFLIKNPGIGYWTGEGWSFDKNVLLYYQTRRAALADFLQLRKREPEKSLHVVGYSKEEG